MLFLLLLLTHQAFARSSGAAVCDALGVCASGVCPDGMEKVAPPTRSTKFSVRTGDNVDHHQDVKEYIPGKIMDIHVRALSTELGKYYSGKYIGVLLYAVKSGVYPDTGCPSPGCDGFKEEKVGEWIIAEGERFQAVCNNQALTHMDAAAKNFRQTFHFQAPEQGTGDIIFRVIVKVGPTQGGWFYWPMKKDLVLKEGKLDSSSITWVQGKAGESCTKVCRDQDQECSNKAMSGVEAYDSLKQSYVCPAPLVSGCSDPSLAPFVDEEGDCFVSTQSCAHSSSKCSAKHTDNSRFCACTPHSLTKVWKQEVNKELSEFPWLYAGVSGGGCLVGCAVVLAWSLTRRSKEDELEDIYLAMSFSKADGLMAIVDTE